MLRRSMMGLLAGAVALAAEPVAADRAVLREVRTVEQSMDGHFRSLTGDNPMGMVGYTRGGYIDGFGAVFTMEVNLAPTANVSPFRQSYSEEEKRQLNIRKRQRLENLEAEIRGILLEEGGKLASVPEQENVAVVVSLFHFRWEDLSNLPSQLVMQARRKALIDERAGRLSRDDFRKELQVRYF